MRTTGQSSSNTVFEALFVNNLVLEAQQLGEDQLLPRRVEPLIRQVDQTALISEYSELGMLKVGTPLLHS